MAIHLTIKDNFSIPHKDVTTNDVRITSLDKLFNKQNLVP